MLWHRVLTAAVGIPVALLLIYLGGLYLTVAVVALALLGLREFYRLAACLGRPARDAAHRAPSGGAGRSLNRLLPVAQIAGYGLAVVAPLASHLPVGMAVVQAMLTLALVVGACLTYAVRMGEALPHAVARFFGVLLGATSLPALLSYLVLLRSLGEDTDALRGADFVIPSGACWLFLVFATCWAMDTAAYAVGKKWGKRKLCPTISPGKTVEGSVAGLVAAVLIVSVFGSWFALPLRQGLLLGLVLGVVGQLGDLAESKLKRWAGVKDSGAILPGHGGVLDRFDSLLFSAPAAYYYLRFVVGM